MRHTRNGKEEDSASFAPGGQTAATVEFSRSSRSHDQVGYKVPVYCSNLPAGVRCDFADTIPNIFEDMFGSGSTSGTPTDDYGGISNAEETTAYISTHGQGASATGTCCSSARRTPRQG